MVDHFPFLIVPGDGRASQFFENAELDFVWPAGVEAIESFGDAFQIFAGQSGNQVGVEVYGGHRAERADVFFDFHHIHSAFDACGDFGIKRLYADFELEEAGRCVREKGFEFLRKEVRLPFEVEHHAVAAIFEEIVQDGCCVGGVGVEGSINEFENPSAALDEFSKHWKQCFWREKADAVFESGEAVFTREGASARAFDVEAAVGEVGIGVFIVGQGDFFQIGGRRVDHLRQAGRLRYGIAGVPPAFQESSAKLFNDVFAFAADEVVGIFKQGEFFGVVAHLGAADHDFEVGADGA